MNKQLWNLLVILAIGSFLMLTGIGCYHATITTGLPPSGQTKTTWAHSWIYGLVPPSVVAAQSECSNGVAQVETQLTFVNGLISSLTWGVYTPMQIKVTCASSRTGAQIDSSESVTVQYGSDYSTIMDAFSVASEKAVKEEKSIYVVFRESASE